MTDSADLDKIEKAVRAASEECGAMVLEAIVTGDNLSGVAVDGETFPALISHLRPRLVYMFLSSFDAEEEIKAHFEEDELDRDLNKLALKWKGRDGQSSRLVLGLMADGIMHGIIEEADWFSEFEEEADALVATRQEAMSEAFATMQENDNREREAEEKKRLAPYVEKLISDLRFVAPKISAAKRETLAETLFPSLDRTTIKKVVERAANQLWLAGPAK